MSEVTEGELVVWSVDPGPMAGVLERQLWRMATAARSYLNRMRAAELAHGVAAGERDAVTVERDEARQEMSDNRSANLNSIGEKIREIARLRKVCEKLEDERDESRKDVANYERQIEDARAILGAAAGDLLSDAAERAACAVQHEANAMDIIGRALGRKVVGGADVAAIHASEEIDRLRERVKALVGAERERDRLLRSEVDACAILGAAPDELLSDVARRHARTEELVAEARKYLGPLVCDPDDCDIEDLAVAVSKRVARMVESRNERADEIAALRARLDAAEAEPSQAGLREILRARDGEPLGDAARRLAASRDEMMEEASRARTELGARADESAEDAALRVMRDLVRARSAQDEVFRIQHEIAIAGDLVTIRVAPLRDPAILALPLGVRLGLVVCDE